MQTTEANRCYHIKGYGGIRRRISHLLDGKEQVGNVRDSAQNTFNVPFVHALTYTYVRDTDRAIHRGQKQRVARTVIFDIPIIARRGISANALHILRHTGDNIVCDARTIVETWIRDASNNEHNRVFVNSTVMPDGAEIMLGVVKMPHRPPMWVRVHHSRRFGEWPRQSEETLDYVAVVICICEGYVPVTDIYPMVNCTPANTVDNARFQEGWTECKGFGKRLAFAMGLHGRLGENSILSGLHESVVAQILQFVRNEDGCTCGMQQVVSSIFAD